jgi:hypothetical protein
MDLRHSSCWKVKGCIVRATGRLTFPLRKVHRSWPVVDEAERTGVLESLGWKITAYVFAIFFVTT